MYVWLHTNVFAINHLVYQQTWTCSHNVYILFPIWHHICTLLFLVLLKQPHSLRHKYTFYIKAFIFHIFSQEGIFALLMGKIGAMELCVSSVHFSLDGLPEQSFCGVKMPQGQIPLHQPDVSLWAPNERQKQLNDQNN